MKKQKFTAIYWLLPLILGFVVFAINLRGTLVYDDSLIQNDVRLKDPHQWKLFLTEGYYQGSIDNLWRPLVSFTYAIQYYFHGEKPWPYHLVNNLLHAIVSALVAVLGRRLVDCRVGLMAGLIFAVHPIHVEAVAGIVGRAESMAAIGMLMALITYLKSKPSFSSAAKIVGWYLFALFSKEQGILIPMIIAGIVFFRKYTKVKDSPTQNEPVATIPNPKWLLSLFLVVTAAYITYRNHILPWYWERDNLDFAMNPVIRAHGIHRILLPISIIGKYVAMLFYPAHLSVDYSLGVFTEKANWQGIDLYIGFVAIPAAITTMFLALRRKIFPLFFCVPAMAVCILMVCNIVIIGTVFGERLAYLPSMFFCLLVAMGLNQIRATEAGENNTEFCRTGVLTYLHKLQKLRSWSACILLAFILGLGSYRTIAYARLWNHPERLFWHCMANQPDASNTYVLLAWELMERREIDQADRLLAEGRRRIPRSSRIQNYSAKVRIKQGRFAQGLIFAREAFRLRPGDPLALALITQCSEGLSATTQNSVLP